MKREYRNPVPFTDGKRRTNPDPYILRWCGKYYCYSTDARGVRVSVSKDLVNWEDRGYALEDPACKDFWAPSVFYQNGTFYMYYSNIPSDQSDCHLEHLKLAVSRNPEKGFQWKKTFFEEFSIDSHPVKWNGRLYMFYSVNNWIGTDERITGTCILVDEMKTPEEFSGNPRAVILPTLPQEIYEADRFGDGRDWYTIEGAAHVVHGNRCWLMYSANAYGNVDYFVGTAVAQNRDDLLDMGWKKYPDPCTWAPLLCKNDKMEGTGHNTVTKAPNLTEDWIVYHGRRAEEKLLPDKEQREMCIDPLYFSGDRLICPGPRGGGEAPSLPEVSLSQIQTDKRTALAKGGDFYQTELWVSGQQAHYGSRWGILLEYQDENNWFELIVHSGRRELQAVECRGGITRYLRKVPLEKGYDYTVPHLFQIEKCFEDYTVFVDETELMKISRKAPFESTLELVPHFSLITLYSFAMTRTVRLSGGNLGELGRICQVTPCIADGEEIQGKEMPLKLIPECPWECYTEILQVRPEGHRNCLSFCGNKGRKVLAESMEKVFSVIHIVRGTEEIFLVDGKQEGKWESRTDTSWEYSLEGLAVLEYEVTKN